MQSAFYPSGKIITNSHNYRMLLSASNRAEISFCLQNSYIAMATALSAMPEVLNSARSAWTCVNYGSTEGVDVKAKISSLAQRTRIVCEAKPTGSAIKDVYFTTHISLRYNTESNPISNSWTDYNKYLLDESIAKFNSGFCQDSRMKNVAITLNAWFWIYGHTNDLVRPTSEGDFEHLGKNVHPLEDLLLGAEPRIY